MKITRLIVLAPFFLMQLHASIRLADEGKSEAQIVLPAGSSPELKFAAEDLQYHLKQMTGASLEITDSAVPGRPAIVLGRAAVELGAKPPESERNQGFHLLTKNGQILIAGVGDEGTSNGIYTFLSNLGCAWVMPGKIGECIPKKERLAIDDMDVVSVPSFAFRRLWYRGAGKYNTKEDMANLDVWLQRQRMRVGRVPLELGGAHFWGTLIKKYPEEFAADPEMLALVRQMDGTYRRRGPQIESTNPKVVKLIARYIREEMAARGLPKDAVVGFPIGPADGLGYSESPESVLAGGGRTDPVTGNADSTDLVVLLANQVLEELGDEYPNVEAGFYSYSTHANYPLRYDPNRRVNVLFAPISFSRYHSVFDTNSKTRPYYKDIVELWGAKHAKDGNKLAYRGYNFNLAENMLPYTMLKMLGEELPWYYKNGVRYLSIEATKAWSINAPHDYLLARMSWDVTRPWQEVLREFCEHSYGKGAGKMEEYFLKLVDRQHSAGQEAGSYQAIHLMYDLDFVKQCEDLLAAASAAATEPDQKERVGFIGMGVQALKLYLEYHAASVAFDFPRAKKCYDAMVAHWEACYAVNTQLVAKEAPLYLKRYITNFVDTGLQYSTNEYAIVARLPDELKSMPDPNNTGEKLNYQSPDLNDRLYAVTRTYSAPWDAQGLTGLRSGAFWYRHHFALKDWKPGQPLGLFIGGVEDEVAVWLNGKFVGTSGRGFSKPFLFDLTDFVRAEGDNLLALKIIRNSAANEIGVGGIIRPCFLFAGPRLKDVAPAKVESQRRVLPGGEVGEVEE
ncbi:MAG TPA: DUF4838 domain-containing protein [Terrimicrobiaceae bacterium]|nr:DUF4838 domain-containing protein [Terrimicrobiaceae bacterium]